MRLSNTSPRGSFLVERPGGSIVRFDFKDSQAPLDQRSVIVRLPAGSTWRPGGHWHERYTEYIRVHEGKVAVLINGENRVVTSEDGVQQIPKFAVHEWMRADIDAETSMKDSTDVVVEEWTDPCRLSSSTTLSWTLYKDKKLAPLTLAMTGDGSKEVFFRNLFSTLEDRSLFGRRLGLQIMLTSAKYDNFDVMLHGRWSWLVTHIAYAGAQLVGKMLGLEAWYASYVSEDLQSVAVSGGQGPMLH